MRVLFVVSDRQLSSVAPGGSGAVFGGLLALLRAAGSEVAILLLRDLEKRSRFQEWRALDPNGAVALESWASSLECLEIPRPVEPGFIMRKILGLFDPQQRAYPFISSGICAEVAREAARVEPDLVMAADLTAGLICSRSNLRAPLVYYHHDFLWKVRKLRESSLNAPWRQRWAWWFLRRAEERLLRDVDMCMTGSVVELGELQSAGARAVTWVPPIPDSEPAAIPDHVTQPCRIVHLGGFRTTATLLGLQRFLDVAWPIIRERLPNVDLWIVGDTSTASREMMARLEGAGAVVAGFIRDLPKVLRPGDLHVIPWEFATGVRTRVLSCFLHGQTLVAVRAGVAAYPDLEDGKQCVLVDRLEELSDPLIGLASNPEKRLELARAGQLYLREHLSVEAVLPLFTGMMSRTTQMAQRHTARG